MFHINGIPIIVIRIALHETFNDLMFYKDVSEWTDLYFNHNNVYFIVQHLTSLTDVYKIKPICCTMMRCMGMHPVWNCKLKGLSLQQQLNIFLKVLFHNTSRLRFSDSVIRQISLPYVSIGRPIYSKLQSCKVENITAFYHAFSFTRKIPRAILYDNSVHPVLYQKFKTKIFHHCLAQSF